MHTVTSHRSDILFAFGVALAIVLAYFLRHVLLLIYVSVLFAVVLDPAVDAIQRLHLGRWRPNRGIALLVIILAGLAFIALFVGFALPPIVQDAQDLAVVWPQRAKELYERIRDLPLVHTIQPSSVQQHIASVMGGALGFFKSLAGGLFGFFSWLILTAYFILDGKRAFYWLMSMFLPAHRERLQRTLLLAKQRVRLWLLGQGALMLALGCASALVFGLLKVRYFYALAVFSGLANIVPILGPIVSVILAGIVAAFDSWTKLAGVLIFFLVYQQVENAFLTPRVMKSTVDLAPLAVVVALALGGALAGILGALVAVPSAALIAVLADEYLVKPNSETLKP